MKKTLTVRGITIGEGVPKICVPLVGKTLVQLKEEAAYLQTLDFDVVEWRVDFFEDVEDLEMVKTTLGEIRSILVNKPIIFTFRSAREGGNRELCIDHYHALIKAIIETGLADIVDLELFTDERILKSLINIAHEKNVYVIISSHEFTYTPPKEEIVARLKKAQALGGDLPKIAVMPTKTADVLTLLDATNIMKEQCPDTPIITISMDGKGVISRLTGEIFGSALTFGAANKASAPGQIAVKDLRTVLNLIHLNL